MARPAKPASPRLQIHPLTTGRMDDLAGVLAGGWGASCWCLFPRLTEAETRSLPGEGPLAGRKRRAMTALARRRRAPGLIAYADGEPVGWIAIAPRVELHRVAASRATPPVDATAVWVIPCITVRANARGRGVALALIGAALDYARSWGAPAVETYPRAGAAKVDAANAYFGTEAMFRRAGFEVVRGVIAGQPKSWLPRVTMRVELRA
jgi:GNAT superfamily N-acetyltransferase